MRGFASVAESIAIDVVIADELTRILNESHAATRAERRRESANFERELEDINTDENKLFDLLSSGAIDEASYKRQLLRIRDRRGEAMHRLAKAKEDWDDAQLDTLRSTLELAKSAKITWAARSVADQRRFLEIHFRTRETSQIAVGYAIGAREAALPRVGVFEPAPRWRNCGTVRFDSRKPYQVFRS